MSPIISFCYDIIKCLEEKMIKQVIDKQGSGSRVTAGLMWVGISVFSPNSVLFSVFQFLSGKPVLHVKYNKNGEI
jgi:hypothetical protein